MTPYIVAAMVMVAGLAMGYVGLSITGYLDPTRRQVLSNLYSGTELSESAKKSARQAEKDKPLVVQVPTLTRYLSPPWERALLARLLGRAGSPANWPLDKVIGTQLFLTLAGIAVGMLFLLNATEPLFVGIGIAVAVLGHFLPELRLYSIGIERKEKITLQLADTLDQMSIAVDAGLGFDAALLRVARKGKGELAHELMRTLQDVQIGMPRRQAYEGLIERGQSPDLRIFIKAIIQADEYGLSLTSVLRTQADEMRLKRRQRAEHKAMQIPTKVIFPLMLLIMPVLMIMVMGPAVISVVGIFSHGGFGK